MDDEKTTVLLIEDNPGDARLIREYISESGSDVFRLEHVERLSYGLKFLDECNIGIILLDLTLPDSQGLEGLGKILAKAPDVPVVVLSGIKDEMVAIEAVHAGAQDYLVKGSIDANLLARLLRHAIERHHLRVALQNSESRYRLLAENIADVVWVADEKGWITYVSPSIERLLGYTVEEVEKLRIRDILTADSAEQARRLIRNQMEVGVQQSRDAALSLTLEHVRKDGSTVWAEVMLSFLLDKKGKFAGIMGSTRDVTARRRAEEALQRSEEHFRSLIENASDAILIINGDGVLQYESPSIQRLLGYRFEERVGKSVFENIHPDDRENVVDAFVQLVQEVGRFTQMAMRVRHKNGSWRIIDVTAKNLLDNPAVGGIVANFRDITERKKAEEALQESETRFRTVFEGTSVAIALVDRRGKPLGVNPAFSRMFGYSFEEFCSLNKLTYLYSEDAMVDAGLYLELINGKRDHYTIDKRYIRKSGEVLWGRQNLSTVRDAEGKPEYFIAMVEDITQRKKMEEEIIRLSDAVKMSTDSIVLTDLQGTVVEANEATLKIQGVKSKEELIGMRPFDTIVPEDREKAFADLAAIMEKGHVNEVHYHIMTRDGRRILLETSASLMRDRNGVPTGVVAVSRDITERKRMEEALRQSEEQFRALVENALDAIVVINGDGVITYASPSNERLLGYPIEQTIGMDGFSFAHPEDMPTVVSAFTKLIENPGKSVSVELRVRHNDGSWRIAEAVAHNLVEDEAVKGIVVNWRDITERKKAEDELRESEERLRLYFESVSDVIYSLDKDFRFVSISPSVEKILGYKPEEVVGKRFDETALLVPETVEQAFVDVTLVLGGERIVTYGKFVRKDGGIIYGEVSLTPIFAPDGSIKGALGVARDVTERKRMEKALHESEERFRRLVSNAQDIVFRWSIDKGLEYVSPAVLNITGYSAEELMSNPAVGMELAREGDPVITADYHKVITEGLSMRSRELSFIRKDGKRIYLDMLSQAIRDNEGKVIAFEGILRDITERKRIEEALRLSERDYKVLFESTLDGLVVLDAETMKIVLANQTAAKLAGVSSSDALIGLDPFQFIPVENRDTVRNIVREDVFEKDLHKIHEYRVFTAEGKEVWVSVVSTRTEYQGKKAALISVRDITERKKAEEEKQKMEEQLRLAGRLAAVGELASGVAHELNNPIAAVQGYAQLLTAKKGIDESVKKDLDVIYREAQRAGKITKNLLSFARRHEPEKRFISINEALDKTLELSAHQMKINNIELEVELDRNLPGTMADFHQMQQIFVNIINNAEQAMLDAHGKGKLVVRTRRYGDMIQITFADDGPGIAEENLKKVFDPFFTTKEVGKGTGLGLSICYGLVEAHNGRIYARSKPGEGATFVVEIPVVPEERPAEAAFIKTKKGSARWGK